MGRKASSSNTKKNHLELRGSTWYVRWDIPIDVRHAFDGKRILKKALSREKAEAIRLSRSLLYEWTSRVVSVRSGTYDPERAVKDALEEVKGSYRQHEEAIAIDVVRTKQEVLSKFANPTSAKAFLESWQGAYSFHEEGTFADYREPVLKSIKRIINFIEVRIGKHLGNHELTELMELEIAHTKELQLAFISDVVPSALGYSEIRRLSKVIPVSSKNLSRHGITDSLLKEWRLAAADQFKRVKTGDDYLSKLRRFKEFLDGGSLEFNYSTVAGFLKIVSPMKKTQSTYLTAIRVFWKWAKRNNSQFAALHAKSPDPTAEHQFPKFGDYVGEPWTAFTLMESQALLDSCLSRRKPDLELACLIAYGFYTGARIEEIGRISHLGTRFESNEPIAFTIEDSKSRAGIREVPLHSELRKLHAILIQHRPKEEGIFGSRPTKRGNQTDHLSKRFGRLKTSLGFGKTHVFHSLRKTFITLLFENRLQKELIQRIVGHKGDDVTTKIYLQDYSLKAKVEGVETITDALDISNLLDALRSPKS